MMQRRRDSHVEGVATHDDPEPCGHGRKDVTEALTGAHAGRVLSREIEFDFQVPRLSPESKATSDTPRMARRSWDLARSCAETPSMCGSIMRENRETL
jgi:RNA-directed DNA polymerase